MNLNALGAVLGEWRESCGHPAEYFLQRGCLIDCRGPIEISPESYFGFGVTVLTRGHSFTDGVMSPSLDRAVTVERGAWICSKAVMFNCRIGEGAVVAIGCVVMNQDVAPGVMVAGNPARVIGRRNASGQWLLDRNADFRVRLE